MKQGGKYATTPLSNEKLAGLDIFFPPADYPVILASFVEKFRTPHRQTRDAVLHRTGTLLLNDTAPWQTDAGELMVQRYGLTLEDGIQESKAAPEQGQARAQNKADCEG